MHPRKNLQIFGKVIRIAIIGKQGTVQTGTWPGGLAMAVGVPGAVGSYTGTVCAVIARGNQEIPIVVPTPEYGKDICYECNLLHELGDLVKEDDIFYTKYEKTGGAVMFTEKDGQRRYLLIKNESGHIGFPKGHIEYGESELETAKREVHEETGLDLVQFGDFRGEYTYHTKEDCIKTGVFFIGHYEYREPTIQADEILQDWLVPYSKALELLNFPEDRELLTRAEQYITKKMREKIKVGMVSLGCPKNQCDAELMLAKISEAGFKIVPEAGLADVVVINTCGFITSAKEEAIEEIMEAISRKNDGINKKIIVTGCLAQRYQEQMDNEFPEIDGVLGIGRNDAIVETIERVLKDERVIDFGSSEQHNMEGNRMQSTLPHYAYLRIADGCDNCCTYCAIPQIRGKFRSREIDNIVREAEILVKNGVKELIVIAQDTTNYGIDIYCEYALPALLSELAKLDVKWIRLLYCYPERMTDELIDLIASEPKICKYIDLPLQHCDGEILHDMGRKGDRASLTALIKKLRSRIPGLTLRTTFITGFPGETEEQFTDLAEFANEIRFDRLGCFAYSQEEDTPAAEFENQVDEREREHRAEIIMEQQEIRVAEDMQKLIGTETEVVCEGYDRLSEMYFGRDASYAPEIDGMIYFTSKNKLHIGDFVNIRYTDCIDNNLIGEVI